ncbi:MAG TPA: matrixin family metalloprotease, partial [Bryobacteraceae bacterium]|nr:matrixin family metalloprotease [Bryobacteraceae bacterium]
ARRALRHKNLKFVPVGVKRTITAAGLRAIAQRASAILMKRDCRGDVPCQFRLSPHPDFRLYPQHTGQISTKADINQLLSSNRADVSIVESISPDACPADGEGTVWGCATATWILVVADRVKMPWILAHEYGHLSGLNHRDEKCALMHSYYDEANLALDQWECDQIHYPNDNPPRPSAPQNAPGRPGR